MTWYLYVLLAIVGWTLANVLDNYVIDTEVKSVRFVSAVFNIFMFGIFLILAPLVVNVWVPWEIILWSMVAGLVYTAGIYLYYLVMQKEDVTAFAPILATEPIFVSVISFFLFQQKLLLIQYLGIAVVLIGVYIISHQKNFYKKLSPRIVALSVLSVFMFASRNLIFEYTTIDFHVLVSMFWMSVVGMIVSLIKIMSLKNNWPKITGRPYRHLFVSAVLSGLALLAFIEAIAIGKVAAVSALGAIKPMAVFLIVFTLSKLKFKLVNDRFDRATLPKKIFATGLIVIGGVLVVI